MLQESHEMAALTTSAEQKDKCALHGYRVGPEADAHDLVNGHVRALLRVVFQTPFTQIATTCSCFTIQHQLNVTTCSSGQRLRIGSTD